MTFYETASEKIDFGAQRKFFAYLATTGLAGLVILGTNSEAMLLTREERAALVRTAREAVGPDFPLMAGVNAFSNVQVLEFIADARAAGANYALLLPPSYFAKATTLAVIESFYDSIAKQSSLPIVLYNFPGVCNGVDLDSDTITRLAKRNPGKIVGVKLTCGSVAKITRLAASLPPSTFSVCGGQSDFLLGGLSVGSAGCIAAFANVFPKSIVRIHELYTSGNFAKALRLQQAAALAESPCKSGINATKYAVSCYSAVLAGIEDTEHKLRPRLPYLPVSEDTKKLVKSTMEELSYIERHPGSPRAAL